MDTAYRGDVMSLYVNASCSARGRHTSKGSTSPISRSQRHSLAPLASRHALPPLWASHAEARSVAEVGACGTANTQWLPFEHGADRGELDFTTDRAAVGEDWIRPGVALPG